MEYDKPTAEIIDFEKCFILAGGDRPNQQHEVEESPIVDQDGPIIASDPYLK